MKALILAGGLGTRIREETEFRPKPMVEIGGRPVLWHIMKNLSMQGINEFVVATGYKSEMIKDFFLNYETSTGNFTLRLGDRSTLTVHGSHDEADWVVSVLDTGLHTPTGGRVSRSWDFMGDEPFLVTYGDGLADVSLAELVQTHNHAGRLATVTTVRPLSRFGVLDLTPSGAVSSFREKPRTDDWVNGGFIVLDPAARNYFHPDSVMETGPLVSISEAGQLAAYRHDGFWQPMDTFRESQMLNQMWDEGSAPWKNW